MVLVGFNGLSDRYEFSNFCTDEYRSWIWGFGPSENFSQISAPGKWFLSWLMLVGRLEMFSALVLLFPSFWKR